VSEEVDPASNEEGDVDVDLEDVPSTVDVKVPAKTPAAESDFAADEGDETYLPAVSDTPCQDNDPQSNDQPNHKGMIEEPNEASCETNESPSQTCPDSQAADTSSQMTRNIPGKALPVAVSSITSELPDKKSETSVSHPPDTTEVESESARNSSAVPADMKSKDSEQSKKRGNKSVSTCLYMVSLN